LTPTQQGGKPVIFSVAATAKHFPGLGAAAADANTDLTVVTLDQPLSELRAVDEHELRDRLRFRGQFQGALRRVFDLRAGLT
jgi:beta-glucosidase-like glycosyl hydrolase